MPYFSAGALIILAGALSRLYLQGVRLCQEMIYQATTPKCGKGARRPCGRPLMCAPRMPDHSICMGFSGMHFYSLLRLACILALSVSVAVYHFGPLQPRLASKSILSNVDQSSTLVEDWFYIHFPFLFVGFQYWLNVNGFQFHVCLSFSVRLKLPPQTC